MRNLLIVCFVLTALCVHAQDSALHHVDSIPASIVGGQDAWRNFLMKNVHSEVPARHGAKVGNYVVTVSFLVDTSGTVSQVQVLEDPGYGTADDVLKAFKHCPKWISASIGGKPVIYRQKQNITYQVSMQ